MAPGQPTAWARSLSHEAALRFRDKGATAARRRGLGQFQTCPAACVAVPRGGGGADGDGEGGFALALVLEFLPQDHNWFSFGLGRAVPPTDRGTFGGSADGSCGLRQQANLAASRLAEARGFGRRADPPTPLAQSEERKKDYLRRPPLQPWQQLETEEGAQYYRNSDTEEELRQPPPGWRDSHPAAEEDADDETDDEQPPEDEEPEAECEQHTELEPEIRQGSRLALNLSGRELDGTRTVRFFVDGAECAVFAGIEDDGGDSDWVAGVTLSSGARVKIVPALGPEVESWPKPPKPEAERRPPPGQQLADALPQAKAESWARHLSFEGLRWSEGGATVTREEWAGEAPAACVAVERGEAGSFALTVFIKEM